NLGNFVNVFGIVEVDEGKANRLTENKPNERDQREANAGDNSAVRKSWAHSSGFHRAAADAGGKDSFLPGFELPDHAGLVRRPFRPLATQFEPRLRIERPLRRPPQACECKSDSGRFALRFSPARPP